MAIPISQLLNEVRADLHEFTSVVWRDNDIVTWINDGIQAVVSETYGMMEDWLTRRMKSTDADETIQGATYDPSSLTITGTSDLYTLPSNLLQVRSIEPLNASDKQAGITFLPRSMTHPEFLRVARMPSQQNQLSYLYAITGANTLRVVPIPGSTVSIALELWYVAMPERLSLSASISSLPIQAMKPIRAYAVWLALQSINSPDVNMKYNVYTVMLREFSSMLSPRQTNDPIYTEGAYDEEDYSFGPSSL